MILNYYYHDLIGVNLETGEYITKDERLASVVIEFLWSYMPFSCRFVQELLYYFSLMNLD